MAASVVSICNMALGHLGISTFISSLDERSKEANICKLYYEQTRDEVLEAFEWGFANKRVALAQSTDSVSHWAVAYVYPSDCLIARRILMEGQRDSADPNNPIPFEVANAGTKQLIMCELESAELVYTVRVTDPNMFSSSFISAMTNTLASKIAMPLTVATTIAQMADKRAAMALSAAITSNLREGQEDKTPDSEFITSRY